MKFAETLHKLPTQLERVWGKIKGYRWKGNNVVGGIYDESGHVLCEKEEVRKRWKEYYITLTGGRTMYNTVK